MSDSSDRDKPEDLDALLARMPWLAPGRVASAEDLARSTAAAERAEREKNLEPYRGLITPDDRRRIVADQLDSKTSEVVRRFVRKYDEDGAASMLWISGPRGCGKTVACLDVLARRGGVAVMMTELVKALRADAYHTRELAELRQRIVRSRVLIVDDVGVDNAPEVESPVLFDLVHARQGLDGLTFFTSNAVKAKYEKYDPRMRDRLAQRGFTIFVEYPSLRKDLSAR